mmetsp:Transcript_21330/g.32497  ORF Transcript_21330/g.32497 Transcript_21330/m.32497 type:complete len:201 (+) Transcript_21330:43-645(+)
MKIPPAAIAALLLTPSASAFGTIGLRPRHIALSRKSKLFTVLEESSSSSTGEGSSSDDEATEPAESDTTLTPPVLDESEFSNDGPFSFMTKGLKAGGIEEGKKITYGVFAQDVTEKIVSEEQASRLRATAAENLMNIDDEERARRAQVGNALLLLSVVIASYNSLFVDQGDFVGHVGRFISVLPVFTFGYAYNASAKEGL